MTGQMSRGPKYSGAFVKALVIAAVLIIVILNGVKDLASTPNPQPSTPSGLR